MVVAVNVTSANESYSFTQMVIEASNGVGFFSKKVVLWKFVLARGDW